MLRVAALTNPVSNQVVDGETVTVGIQNVNSGGAAANETVIDSGGTQYIIDGGVATNSTVTGGEQSVSNGV